MFYVYLLASGKHGTLNVGVTRNLVRRVDEQKSKIVAGFAARFRLIEEDNPDWSDLYPGITA
jgi:putative endonuclease